jgi:hypothetical protein
MKGLMMIFKLPCYIHIGYEKVPLNLNWYRNAHFQLLNKTKQAYYPDLFVPLFKASEISISYTLVWNSKRRTDLMNWIAVADKYFLDWLVAQGYIPDDSLNYYHEVSASAKINTTVKSSYIIAEVKVIK